MKDSLFAEGLNDCIAITLRIGTPCWQVVIEQGDNHTQPNTNGDNYCENETFIHNTSPEEWNWITPEIS
jgi:hypothetical protein